MKKGFTNAEPGTQKQHLLCLSHRHTVPAEQLASWQIRATNAALSKRSREAGLGQAGSTLCQGRDCSFVSKCRSGMQVGAPVLLRVKLGLTCRGSPDALLSPRTSFKRFMLS